MFGISIAGIILVFIFVSRSVKVLNESQRAAVFRLGKFEDIVGPGLVLIIPYIDRLFIVDLDSRIPGWQGLSQEHLRAKVKEIALGE